MPIVSGDKERTPYSTAKVPSQGKSVASRSKNAYIWGQRVMRRYWSQSSLVGSYTLI